jgi:capsular exopolysaccharide synthesis family protein
MKSNLVSITDPTSPAAEAYRRLRVNLIAAGRTAPLRTLLVAAAGPGPDKAAIVANLAVTFARVGKRVILADCDLRHPGQHTLLGLSNTAGVTTALAAPQAALPLQAVATVPGLWLLAAGPMSAAPADVAGSPAMADLLARLAAEADLVLLDAPPVNLATDASELATRVDGVLLTISAGHTRRDDALRAKELLERVGARLVGATLANVAPDAALRKYLTS